jgi:hypothetical protein
MKQLLLPPPEPVSFLVPSKRISSRPRRMPNLTAPRFLLHLEQRCSNLQSKQSFEGKKKARDRAVFSMHTGPLVIATATPSLWLIPPRD